MSVNVSVAPTPKSSVSVSSKSLAVSAKKEPSTSDLDTTLAYETAERIAADDALEARIAALEAA